MLGLHIYGRSSMRNHWLKAPSPAFVVSLIALFVALGGTSYAARNAVFSSKTAAGLTTLPSGHSESGMFAGSQTNGYIGTAINYPRPLPAAIADTKIIDVHGKSARYCAGPGHALPGYLCLYNTDESALTSFKHFYSSDGDVFPASEGKLGVLLFWLVGVGGYVGGSWTVTAA
jgi:hypothetical protein